MSRRKLDIETEDWKFRHIFGNMYKAEYKPDYIGLTSGVAVTQSIKFPFPFRLVRASIYHSTGTITDASTDPLTIVLKRPVGKIETHPAMVDEIWKLSSSVIASNVETFGEAYEFESGEWELSLTGHQDSGRVYPLIYVQKYGGGILVDAKI